MELLKKKELSAKIGKRGVFTTLPDLIDKVRYEKGISVFDAIKASHELGHVLSFIGHPEGIEIKISATGEAVALPYSEILNYEILDFSDKRYLLEINRINKPALYFNYLIEKSEEITKYFYTIQKDRVKEKRDEETAQKELEFFANVYARTKSINVNHEILTSAFGKNKKLIINDSQISWGDDVLDFNDCSGVCYSKTETSVSGFKASLEYRFHLHKKEGKAFKIVFGKSFGIGEAEAEVLYNTILDALFEIVIKKQIQDWILKFANNERVKISNLQLSREGVSYIKKGEEVLIHWEHMSIESFEMNLTFKSRMNKRHAFHLGLPHNPEAWPLLSLCEYIMSDVNRLKLITG